RLMSQGRTAEVHQEVARAVLGYLSDKLDASASGLTHATIERLLAERGVEQKLRSDLIGCLEACDYARFAPSSAGAADLKAAIESSERIIARLEGALSGRRGARGAA
ncbi:MAG TPA: hypothetical protein VFP98_03340, partial [Candidatus Polarisedimenticolia bacterium]|nr:hypothetical protein [Candidatus Polarisedimenticolia bacterium]